MAHTITIVVPWPVSHQSKQMHEKEGLFFAQISYFSPNHLLLVFWFIFIAIQSKMQMDRTKENSRDITYITLLKGDQQRGKYSNKC